MWVIMCYAAVYILEACILWQYCRNLFPSKYTRQQEAVFLFLGYSVLFAASFFDNSWLNLVLFFFINLICIFIMYQHKLLTALFHALFITISMLLGEVCISRLFFYFEPAFYGKGTDFRNLVIISIISKLLYFLILQCVSIYIKQFLEMQLLLQKEYDTALYFDALHWQDEKQKILIHDIRKHLLSIAVLNKKGDTRKITAYIDQIIQSSDLQNPVRICDNNILNTILFHTRQQCKEYGISILTDIRSGCTDFLSEYDMTALFSNLLDNAVDAAKSIPESFIELSVTPHSDKKIIITMVNSCRKDPFSKNGRRLNTTKKDKQRHGYGMKSIQRVISKYDGDSRFYFDEENDTFHAILILKRLQPGTKR